VRVVDVFVDELRLHDLGFEGAEPAGRADRRTTRSAAQDLHLRLSQPHPIEPTPGERSATHVELMWLTRRLAPDFKTIADFRRDHGDAIAVCREFVVLCRRLKLFTDGIVAIDGTRALMTPSSSRRRPPAFSAM
jgi:hypothetical protein